MCNFALEQLYAITQMHVLIELDFTSVSDLQFNKK